MTEISPQPRIRRRIAAWNILLDARFPQEERVDDIAHTLAEQGDLDLVGLLEVQKTANQQNGEIIAQKLTQTSGVWFPHSRKSSGEHTGVFGADVKKATTIDLGHKKKAVLTELGDVAIVLVHLRRQHKHFPRQPEQIAQVSALLEAVADYEKVIAMGDFNCLPFQMPRTMLRNAGFQSAYVELGEKRPRFPTNEFRDALSPRQKLGLALAGGAISIDDIYTRGMEDSLVSVTTFQGRSDHPGLLLEYGE